MHTTIQLFKQVTVITSARLHMGFYDLSHGAHQFGGLGLALHAPNTQVKVSTSEKLLIDAKSSKNIAKIIDKLVKSFNLPENFSVNVLQNIPQHAGLGSGTQMALAIGESLNQLFNLKLSIAQIAAAAGRGRRSGIGIGAFELGGLLVDNGKQGNAQTSIASRMSFPSDWRVLLISDSAHVGVHGALELSAFGQLNPAQDNVKNLVFKYMLPALLPARPTAIAGLPGRLAMTVPLSMFMMPLPASPTHIWIFTAAEPTWNMPPLETLTLPTQFTAEPMVTLFAVWFVHAPPMMFKTPLLLPVVPKLRPTAIQLFAVTEPPTRLNSPSV